MISRTTTALGSLLFLASCSTTGPLVTHTDFGQAMHDIRVEGGESLPPDEVRELFDRTAKQVCLTVDAKPGYRILIPLEQPNTVEPLWNLPEGRWQQGLARRHYDLYRSNMEAKILCE